MPLTINVGLSRKASKDYQSTGVSINIVAELDQALLAKPAELQQQVDGLYQQAEAALARQTGTPPVAAKPRSTTAPTSRTMPKPNGNGHADGRTAVTKPSGNGHTASGGRKATPMSAAQRRAIDSIGQRLGLDIAAECRDVFGWNMENLSIGEASRVIDHLKSLQTSHNGERS